jgi:hypothetical protein
MFAYLLIEQDLTDEELRRREAEVEAALSQRYRTDRGFGAAYDRAACSAINPLSSEVVKVWNPRHFDLRMPH